MSVSRLEGDPVVNAVLTQIYEVSQIDPTCVVPDYHLGSDLGLDRVQIQTVLYRSAEALGYQVAFEYCRVEDSTARELVNILKRWGCSNLKRAA